MNIVPNEASVRLKATAQRWCEQQKSLDVTSRSGSRVAERVTTNVNTCVSARSLSRVARYSSAMRPPPAAPRRATRPHYKLHKTHTLRKCELQF